MCYGKDAAGNERRKGVTIMRTKILEHIKKSNIQTSDIDRLRRAIDNADAVLIGAGAGLSTAAGFVYAGERFKRYFFDFEEKYEFHDMYSGGFYPYDTQEEFWAYWSRYIWVNRYMDAPKPVYDEMFSVVRNRDYFVLTTNVDHCFQKAGFDKRRLFYTQGDYGLFQCSEPCCKKTWDNEAMVRDMVLAQGFVIGAGNALIVPGGIRPAMAIPTELLPKCPHCGKPLTMNLRSDDRFVEDAGWHAAAKSYLDFTEAHSEDRILYLEIGVGWNTPGIIKFNFWNRANENPNATYACLNYDDARIPRELVDRGIGIAGDSAQVIEALTEGQGDAGDPEGSLFRADRGIRVS